MTNPVNSLYSKYSSGEIYIPQLPSNSSLSTSPISLVLSFENNDDIIAGLFKIHAVHNANPSRPIHIHIPYMAYSRGDKLENDYCGAKIIAGLIPNFISSITLYHLHNPIILNYFNCPTRHKTPFDIIPSSLFASHPVLVATDLGSSKDIIKLATIYGCEYCIALKDRTANNFNSTSTPHLTNFMGQIDPNKDYLIIDDMVDSGQTLINVVEHLRQHKPKSISCWATHSILSTPESHNIPSYFDNFYTTNSHSNHNIIQSLSKSKCNVKIFNLSIDK
jgi:ribose-phosphate pyrophosphokinase